MSDSVTNKTADFRQISELYIQLFNTTPAKITPLAGAGSNRRYFQVKDNAGKPVAATCGDDPDENLAFINLSRHLAGECNLPVPTVLAVSSDNTTYIQTWAGEKSLFDVLSSARESGGYTFAGINLLEESMKILARIQYEGGKKMNYEICYPHTEMDARLVRWDLNYFKYCFLKPSGLEFDEAALQTEFDSLENLLLRDKGSWPTFMLRDFQSRNIMVDDGGRLTVIDFQGGRRGPAAYDVASFLWQAKARYPEKLKRHLIEVYINEVKLIYPSFEENKFKEELPLFVLFRCLQTLGAYGFRGWIEKKPHFLQSVPAGVENLSALLADDNLADKFPTLRGLSKKLCKRFGYEAVEGYNHHIPADKNHLTVRVTSFSFKNGIPGDPSGNGGGFVFDCRATHNPGRYEPYKKLTGLDAPVRVFLEKDGEIQPFIGSCKRLIDASVERYLQRGFTDLVVNFGCTGGQHRSVYSADAVAKHLNDKYGVKVLLTHREQGISVELPAKDVEVCFDSFLRAPQKPYIPGQ